MTPTNSLQPRKTPEIHGDLIENLSLELQRILTKGFPPKYPTLNQEKKPKQHGEPES